MQRDENPHLGELWDFFLHPTTISQGEMLVLGTVAEKGQMENAEGQTCEGQAFGGQS